MDNHEHIMSECCWWNMLKSHDLTFFPLSEVAIDSKSFTIKPTSMLGLGLTLVLAGCRANTVTVAKNSVHSFVAFLTTSPKV